MLIFGLRSTSGDRLSNLSNESQPKCDKRPPKSSKNEMLGFCHPSPAKKMKCSFLDYVQLLMIGRADQWTRTPSATPLQQKKIKCSVLDYIQHLMIGQAGRWT